ncbi:MAG: VWA domain-containing protein [Elusimicrobiota bacterium]|jgi:Ca-activated chloride channel family protein
MFRNPIYLLWMLPAASAVFLLHFWADARRRKITARLGDPATIARLVPEGAAQSRRIQTWLQTAATALLFAALAGPQWGVELTTTRSDARQVFIAVDTSLSMTAEDVPPSRLEKAKRELSLLLDSLPGDRVGVIAFAGNAGILCPLTTDIAAAKQILASLSVGSIPEPGTAIGSAVRLAASVLQRYPGGKALVLLTDGEDHHTDPLGAAAEAAAAGVRIYAIGIGTPEGNPLPIKEDGSGALTGYKKDRKGQTVISRLGEKSLMDMAASAGGAYWRASPSEDEIAEIAHQIENLEKSQGVSGTANQYKNRFIFPLAAALLLLLADLLVPWSQSRRLKSAPTTLLLLLLLCLPGSARAASRESALRSGNKLYGERRYQEALGRYRDARRPADPRPEFNAGDALYRLEDYDSAAQGFQRLGEDPRLPDATRSHAFYNLGNALVQKQDYAGAVAAFRKAVILSPSDPDARHNLAVALRMLQDPPPPKKQCDKPKPKPDDKDKNNDPQKPGQPPPPASRPQDRMSKDDAERIMRSVAEKEKTDKKQPHNLVPRPQQKSRPNEEDW